MCACLRLRRVRAGVSPRSAGKPAGPRATSEVQNPTVLQHPGETASVTKAAKAMAMSPKQGWCGSPVSFLSVPRLLLFTCRMSTQHLPFKVHMTLWLFYTSLQWACILLKLGSSWDSHLSTRLTSTFLQYKSYFKKRKSPGWCGSVD